MFGFLIAAALAGQVSGGGVKQDKTPPPSDEHKKLDVLAGAWNVTTKYKLGEQEHEGTAICETKWILDGHYLQQEYKTTFNGAPYTVLQIVGYDAARKRFFELKMDSLDTAVLHTEGSMSADGKAIINAGSRVDPPTRSIRRIKSVTTFIDHDHYTLEWFQTGPDGKDVKFATLTHSRKKP